MLTIRQLFQDAKYGTLAFKCARTMTISSNSESCEQKPKHLSIVLPDLSDREKLFIRKQIDIISNPQCILEDFASSEDESNRRLFERIFPSTREQRNLVACARQIQSYYPNFLVPRRKTDLFNRNMVSPVFSQRIADGLRFCGIKEGTLLENPEWVLFSTSSYLEEAELIEKADGNIADMVKFARLGRLTVRGRFIASYVEKLRDSLILLKMEDAADMLSNLNFNIGETLSLKEFFNICNQPVVESIARRRKLPLRAPKEALFMMKEKKSPATSPIKIARNFYISEEVIKNHPRNFRSMRVYLSPEPMDTLITLNSFYETLTDQLGSTETPETFLENNREVCSQMVAHVSKHLPIPIRLKLLQAIGFSSQECLDILCSPKCQKYSDNQGKLYYSSSDYIDIMKSRLKDLKEKEQNTGSLSGPEAWSLMIDWSSQFGQPSPDNHEDSSLTQRLQLIMNS